MAKWGLSRECKAALRVEDQGYQKQKKTPKKLLL